MQLKVIARNLIKLNRIATLLAVGITVSTGVPALAYSTTTDVPNTSGHFIKGGTNLGNTLYICTAQVNGQDTPGKYYPPDQACYVPYGGKEFSFISSITFYKSDNWRWIAFQDKITNKNVIGGMDNDDPLYFCRAKIFTGEYTPGKYYSPTKTCYVPYGGLEYQFTYGYSDFQILIAN
ncbi:DM9 repeat-containing protein [Nostoc sp.]|uniref:DM9 repeat-containing protein n=1 Tax=Nostoc sp. TaxID=1180 RepID=UPI002FF76796